jgi:hypothetical protein
MKGVNKKGYTRRQFINNTWLVAAGHSICPFIHEEELSGKGVHNFSIVTVDAAERGAKTE